MLSLGCNAGTQNSSATQSNDSLPADQDKLLNEHLTGTWQPDSAESKSPSKGKK
jgi:hypothetical protein